MSIVDVCFMVLFWLFAAATLVNSLWYLIARLPEPTQSHFQQETVRENLTPVQEQGVTVLICARNEAFNLRRYLPVVLEQASPVPFEVLVVDDASSDDTPDVLAFFQEQYAHLNVLRLAAKKIPGKKHALSQGIASAKYDLLLLTDADCQPRSAQWLTLMSAPLQQQPSIEIVLGYAPCGWSDTTAPTTWLDRWMRFETVHTAWTYFAFARLGLPYMGVGRNLALRKRAFARVGGFTTHLHLPSGDDDLLVNAISTQHNTSTCLDPRSFVFSEGKKTWLEWYKQKCRHLSTGTLYRPTHRMLLGALALSHSGHFAALLVLTFSIWGACAWILWAMRIIVVWLGWLQTSRSFREPHMTLHVPILDAMMGTYFGVFGLILAFSRKRDTEW